MLSTLVFKSVMAVVRVWTWASSLPMARKYSGSVMGAFSCSRPSWAGLLVLVFHGWLRLSGDDDQHAALSGGRRRTVPANNFNGELAQAQIGACGPARRFNQQAGSLEKARLRWTAHRFNGHLADAQNGVVDQRERVRKIKITDTACPPRRRWSGRSRCRHTRSFRCGC
jgi:hypothetical protein